MVVVLGEAVLSRQVGGASEKNSGVCKKEFRSGFEETITVNTVMEMPNGYPNLEGYVPEFCPITDWEMFDTITDQEIFESVQDFDLEMLDVSINGTAEEWLVQALNYQSERPTESVRSCLDTFEKWDNTNTDKIRDAMDLLVDVPFGRKEMGNMTDQEYRAMATTLLDIAEQPEIADLFLP